MSFIYQDLRDRERTCIKEKVKSRSKYTCSEIPYDPVEMTDGNQYWPYFWSYYVGLVWPNWSKWTKMAKMTITAWPDMARNMANMGFHAMNRTNVDHQ